MQRMEIGFFANTLTFFDEVCRPQRQAVPDSCWSSTLRFGFRCDELADGLHAFLLVLEFVAVNVGVEWSVLLGTLGLIGFTVHLQATKWSENGCCTRFGHRCPGLRCRDHRRFYLGIFLRTDVHIGPS